MRKSKKKLIIIITIAVLIVVGAIFLMNPIRSIIAFNSMTPLETGEVMSGIFAVKNEYVNLFLIKCDDTYIAFDAGNDIDAVKSALDVLGIAQCDIAVVFLTHTDYDHVGALSLFPMAKLYMASSNRDFLGENEGQDRSKIFIDMSREYSVLNDDETITVANRSINCLFTPGHTDGSACFVVDGKYLFTGDTMRLQDGKAALSYSVFNIDDDEQKASLNKLFNLDGIEAVFTMHTGYTTDFTTAFSAWKE